MDGDILASIARTAGRWRDPDHPGRRRAVAETLELENRFTEEAIAFAVNQQMHVMREEALRDWLGGAVAVGGEGPSVRSVGVLHPGNVPLAGLQDLVAVLGTGYRYVGRLSRRSSILEAAFLADLGEEHGGLPARLVEETDALLAGADALVATGTDRTVARMREACEEHGISPERRLLRGHSYAVAVLDGGESEGEREGLAEDALLHEGAGCRNVALIFAPEGLDPDPYLESLGHFRGVFPPHERTEGALEVPRAMLEAVDAPRAWGPGLLVSRGEPEAQGPAHIRWVPYEELGAVEGWIDDRTETVQLVVARPAVDDRLDLELPVVAPGEAQRPPLGWAPDGVDTARWLAALGR